MKNLYNKLSLFSVLALVAFEPQKLRATSSSSDEEIQDSQKPQKSIPSQPFDFVQNTFQIIKDGLYDSEVFLKDFFYTHLEELKECKITITPNHDLFDNYITLILNAYVLKAFPKDLYFDDCLKAAKERGESEHATPAAQCNLGIMYEYSEGVDQDYTKAFEYYKKSADQGNVIAQHILGTWYKYGHNINRDYTQAYEYYKKAADQGNARALYDVGYMYENKKGIYDAQFFKKAIQYYEEAANKGNKDAQHHLACIFRREKKDGPQALKWFSEFAKNKSISIKNDIEKLVRLVPSAITPEDEKSLIDNQKILKSNIKAFLGLHDMEGGINQPDSPFKKIESALYFFFDFYKQDIDFEDILLRSINGCFQSGFMVTCLQPKNVRYFSLTDCPDIKYYKLQDKVFLTFGLDNIKEANKLISIFDQDYYVYKAISNSLNVLTEIHQSFETKDQLSDLAEKLKTQYEFRARLESGNQSSDETSNLTLDKKLADKVEGAIEALTQLKAITQQLQYLLIESAPIRNRLFLQNNEHIKRMFED